MQTNRFLKKKRTLAILGISIFLMAIIFIRFAVLAFTPLPPARKASPRIERGSIVDRSGKPLAVSTNFYDFGVTPSMIEDVEGFAETVAQELRMNPIVLQNMINSSQNPNYVSIKKKLSEQEHDRLSALIDENGFNKFCRFDRIPGRVYPLNDLASQLIGYMGIDGKGLSGMEYQLQDILVPEIHAEDESPSIYGKNVYLTIDSDLQLKMEEIAKASMEQTQAENFMLIAMDVKSGEILSYLSLPEANLNSYSQAKPEQMIDRPANSAYEPGSVFKIFTAAAYLDSGAINENTLFLCDGLYTRTTNLNETIRINCLDRHGYLSVRGALELSCNDAFAQMSDLLPTDLFLTYIDKFGFGKKTKVELPAERIGYVKTTKDKSWSARTKATMSIGQELTVTALQMVQAAGIIANDGIPVKMTFIKRIKDKDGKIEYEHTPEYGSRVLKQTTTQYILSCMETTAEKGTGVRAALGDISIGVKTGTAQMADPIHGGYSETDFLSNCLAVFPVEKPQIVLYIVIQKAKGETYAGRIVAPVIREAADEIIDHLGMSREGAPVVGHSGRISIQSNVPITLNGAVPDFIGRPKRDLIPVISSHPELNFVINGEGWVKSQKPAPGSPIMENMTIELNLE
ncbi:MAG: transpeptidase family protein [Treponema sp.]|nr:transpeptidase family protein [Treponema sp.]